MAFTLITACYEKSKLDVEYDENFRSDLTKVDHLIGIKHLDATSMFQVCRKHPRAGKKFVRIADFLGD